MRRIFIAVATIFVMANSAVACPQGYLPCGESSCCIQ